MTPPTTPFDAHARRPHGRASGRARRPAPALLPVAVAAALTLVVALAGLHAEKDTSTMPAWNKLTPEETRVIVHKGTERAFTGEYWKHYEPGTYVCRRCNAALYVSDTKFDSRCGWPSFDDEIPGAVRRLPDADGHRTEIVCAACDGHLGHVFLGEGFTPKNTRHCVNSISIRFIPAGEELPLPAHDQPATAAPAPPAAGPATARAIFAGGCFWGVEHLFKDQPGVLKTTVGYTGGHKLNPTYKEVCTTDTGHAEAIEIVFDPTKTTYERLARFFFEIHDPTQVDRQGPDRGPQYRSAVFYLSPEQKTTTEALIGELTAKGFKVATQVVPAATFWPAEEYHQDYYTKTGKAPYCHVYVKRF